MEDKTASGSISVPERAQNAHRDKSQYERLFPSV